MNATFREALEVEMKTNGDTSVALEKVTPIDFEGFETDEEDYKNYPSIHWIDGDFDYWELCEDKYDFSAIAYSDDYMYILFYDFENGMTCKSFCLSPVGEVEIIKLGEEK